MRSLADVFENMLGLEEGAGEGCGRVVLAIAMGLAAVAVLWYAIVTGAFQTAFGPNNNVPGHIEGPGEGARDRIPGIPARYYTTGTATASVSGELQFSSEIQLDPYASQTTPNETTRIAFSDPANPDAGDILVALNEPENSVAVEFGNQVALGRDDDCAFDIHVTDSSVSGSVVCASVEVLTHGEPSGTSSIQLQFSTTTVPWDSEEGGPDPYENAPTDEPPTQ